jgi:ribosomal-protein-alanine N-acetyltransferase
VESGYATEASTAVLDFVRSCGHQRVSATVWDRNVASLRVLATVGFSEWSRMATAHGTTVIVLKQL